MISLFKGLCYVFPITCLLLVRCMLLDVTLMMYVVLITCYGVCMCDARMAYIGGRELIGPLRGSWTHQKGHAEWPTCMSVLPHFSHSTVCPAVAIHTYTACSYHYNYCYYALRKDWKPSTIHILLILPIHFSITPAITPNPCTPSLS